MSEPIVIDIDELERARHDPKVRAFRDAALAYRDKLIESGHCRCHLVVNCPQNDETPT